MNKRVFYFMGEVNPGNMNGGVLMSGAPGGGIRVELTGGATMREVDPDDESRDVNAEFTKARERSSKADSGDSLPLDQEYPSDAALRQAAAAAGLPNRVSVVSDAAKPNGKQLWPEFGGGKGDSIRYVRTPTGSVRRMDGSMSLPEMLGTGVESAAGSGTALPMATGGPVVDGSAAHIAKDIREGRFPERSEGARAPTRPGSQARSEAAAKGGAEGQAAAGVTTRADIER